MKKVNKTRFAKRALEDFSRTMIELLSKKPFENIMVSEICEISNYPRATFYNYFEDKYGLLNYCWDCFGEKIDFQNDYDYMDTDEKMYDLFNSLYDFFEKNIEILRRITKQNNQNGEFMQIFKIYMNCSEEMDMRLDKYLAEAGVGRRKDVREYIKQGLVMVNGEVSIQPTLEIKEGIDIILYDNTEVKYKEKVYYMFNKPSGCITATRDEKNKTVFDYFNDEASGIFHVGRLDKDTEGLLLFTNDGEFEHLLMHPSKHINKTYFFWALGSLNESDKKSLEEGVFLQQNEILTKPAKIEIYKEGRYLDFKEEIYIKSLIDVDCKNYNPKIVSGYLTISEGKKHQVKRMLKAVGCYVVYLKRVAIGDLKLDQSLKGGEYRNLTVDEINMLLDNHNY